MKKSMRLPLIALTCCQLISACSSWHRIDDSDRQISALEANGDAAIRKQTKQDIVTDMPSQWVNQQPISSVQGNDTEHDIPPCNLTLNHPGRMTLNELANFISQQCNIPISVTQDARDFFAKAGSVSSGAMSDGSGSLPLPNDNSSSTLPDTSSGGLDGIKWQGSSAGLLDNVTGRLGLGWRYQHKHIEIFYLDTRQFPILFMDSRASFTSKILSGTTTSISANNSGNTNNSGSNDNTTGGKNEGNTTQTTTMEIKSSLYDDISNSIRMMLTPQVGRMSLSSGMLTVMDNSSVMERVSEFIDERNVELNRQVVLNVQVYSVEKQQSDQIGIDWNAVFKNSIGVTLSGSYAAASEAMTSGGISILDGKGAGSSAFIKALSQQANVSMLTQASSMTTNLSAVPIQVALQQDYASNASTENTANVGSTSSINQSTITTGFNMTVLPYLLPHTSRMQLQFSINMSDDPTFRTFKSENASVELMKTRLKTFNQRVMISSGQTLVLSGYQSISNTANHQGTGSARIFALGGGAEGDVNKSMLVILITPVVSD